MAYHVMIWILMDAGPFSCDQEEMGKNMGSNDVMIDMIDNKGM